MSVIDAEQAQRMRKEIAHVAMRNDSRKVEGGFDLNLVFAKWGVLDNLLLLKPRKHRFKTGEFAFDRAAF